MDFQLSTYYPVFLFVLLIVGLVIAILIGAHVIGPRRRTPVKDMPYESGMDPIGSAKQRYDVKFYLIAILFLVFDVELLYLYPWAVSAYELFKDEAERLQTAIFWELLVFIATLAVAYLYAWRRGVFKWR
jgi:NADH:ubiquinone oxidoreductase subunit 3 (subunit A)